MVLHLALEIGRHDRMNSPAMEMAYLSMKVVCVGMYMEQGNREHPQGGPRQDSDSKTAE